MSSSRRRILIVDDEDSIRTTLRTTLESNGYEVREAATGAEGIQSAIEFRPELILLDLGLPDLKGVEVLKRVRSWSSVPVLILTAHDSESEKVEALDGGADDYLTKPFGTGELLARIRVGLRHANRDVQSAKFSVGDFEIDYDDHSVKIGGKRLHLTTTEFDILRILTKFFGKVVTHRTLLKEIWGPNSVEHTQYLRVYVGQLRKKLREATPDLEWIVTEPGVGYRFVDPKEVTA